MAVVGPTGSRYLGAFRELRVPATAVAITAGTDTWGPAAQYFYCATAGDLVYTPPEQTSTVTLTSLAAGMWHPFAIKSITSFSGTGPVVGWAA